MANARFYSSVAVQTTLTGSVDTSTNSITVASTSGFPSSTPYTLALGYGSASEELVDVTNVAGLTLTVTRAVDSTSASAHNIGDVVKHVVSARDFTESRTHEASSTGVHGIAGAVVGTTDSQTLTSKTLTSPTINGGALSGTFTGAHTYSGAVTMNNGGTLAGTFAGTPTFSGAVLFSGGPNFNNGATLQGNISGNPTFLSTFTINGTIQSSQSFSTSTSIASIVSGDTFDRFRMTAAGIMDWGPGNATRDVNLYRSAADVLSTDDNFRIFRPAVGNDAMSVRVAGDTNDRITIDTNSTGGLIALGPGNAATDTNLYRESSGVLKTDGGMKFGGAVTDTTSGIQYRPLESDTITFVFSAVSQVDMNVTFSPAFPAAPDVVCQFANSTTLPAGASDLRIRAFNVTASGCTIRVFDGAGVSRTLNINVSWIAVLAS